MCGIVGIFSNQTNLDAQIVVQMNALQIHRGPDGEGVWSSNNHQVHFGHRRLSIIDLSEGGAQPMCSQDGRYVITYNGEIYNFKALKEKCIARGSVFKSHSDTEVIIEYIRHFGQAGIQDFRGMWAFVLYDTHENTILMSRDPFGIKPLYYGIKDGVLYFSSEIKALRCIDPYFSIIDEITEKMFLEIGVLDIGDWTFFQHIKRFPAAHVAKIDLNQDIVVEPTPYWTAPKQIQHISKKEALNQLKNLLEQSIKRHLVADVDVAFCLSGGLDSSTIVGLANQYAAKNQNLKTFTTHYPDYPEIDETKWAQMAIDHCHTDYVFIKPTYEDFEKEFYEVIYHHDEPFGSTSIYAQNAIFKGIHQAGIKVSLDGQGADEIFAGYHSYFPILLISLLSKGKMLSFMLEAISLTIRHPSLGFKLLRAQGILYFKKRTSFFKRRLSAIGCKCLKVIKRKCSVSAVVQNAASKVENIQDEYQKRLDYLSGLYSIDFHQNLMKALMSTSIPQLLRNGDRNSMRHSVESRVPFLDIDLVNFVIALPNHFKIHRAITKYILRLLAKHYLPKKLVYRKDKLGFPSPEKIWLKKAFNLEVSGAFSNEFRKLMVSKWREVIHAQKK